MPTEATDMTAELRKVKVGFLRQWRLNVVLWFRLDYCRKLNHQKRRKDGKRSYCPRCHLQP